ncbi:MAG: hypothetical protein ACOH2V_12960 [Candidatus Saccharimonadaceae bacterium]
MRCSNYLRIFFVKALTVICLIFIQSRAFGQDTCSQSPATIERQITAVTIVDFFTTFTGVKYINGQTAAERNNLYFYYNLTINNKIKYGKFVMINYYFTELGIRDYKDSITCLPDDQYNFKNSVSFQFGKSKFALNISTNSKSQYFRHYDYKEDSTLRLVKYLYTAYLSPGYQNLSGGLKYEVNENLILEFGLVNGKKTKIKNQQIFTDREASQLYGLKKGTTKKTELGLNLVITIPPHEIFKNLYMENFSQFNVNKTDFKQLKYYRADINNAFHYIFLKHFRLTLRTLCLYDYAIYAKPKLVNNLSIGFYLNNTF